MNCLEHFTGWTSSDPDAEEHVRLLVSKLKLCPLSEPGDVDSPLLRSQIDEQYLRAMAAARAQMSDSTPEQQNRRPHKDPSLNSGKQHTPNAKQKSAGAAHAMVSTCALLSALTSSILTLAYHLCFRDHLLLTLVPMFLAHFSPLPITQRHLLVQCVDHTGATKFTLLSGGVVVGIHIRHIITMTMQVSNLDYQPITTIWECTRNNTTITLH